MLDCVVTICFDSLRLFVGCLVGLACNSVAWSDGYELCLYSIDYLVCLWVLLVSVDFVVVVCVVCYVWLFRI